MKNYFWKSIAPLLSVLLIDSASYGIVIPILGPLLLDPSSHFLPTDTSLPMRTFFYSLSLSLPMAFMFLGAPLLGDISDQIGRKKTLLIALVGIIVSCVVSVLGLIVTSVFLFLAGRALLGLMDSSESVAKAAIADISDSTQQKIMNLSFASIAGTVGFVLGPMLGGVVSSPTFNVGLGFTTPFLLASLLSLLSAGLIFFLFHETYQPKEKKKIRLLSSFRNLKMAFTDHRIRTVAIVFFCMQFAWGTFFQSISILWVEAFHYSATQIGLFLSYLSFCFVITLSIILRVLLNFMKARSLIIFSLFLIVLAGLIITLGHQEIAIWLSVIPMCLGVGLSYNTLLSFFSDAVDKDSQGRIMGVSVALFSSAWIVSSIFGGMLSSVNLYLPYLMASAVALVGFIVSFYIRSA